MQNKYIPQDIEKHLQQVWQENKAYQVEAIQDKQKYYACSMLPYPSGKLHMGHVRNYTINDVMARQLRMKGKNVLMPMGWDAFGMPAENAAINNNLPPAQWTYQNIKDMKEQLGTLGFAIDWTKEVATCSPDYYKWNQWLFLRMREKGIAYRKKGTVNWDPIDQTVLANEQVIDGKGWRSGAVVEKREIPMYYFNITSYAQELLDDLDNIDWPERVKIMQQNWIGKSTGVRFAFPHQIKNEQSELIQDGKLYVFTTRADTIMGVTFCAVAPEHPIAQLAAKNNTQIAQFIEECKQGSVMEADMANMEKKGIATPFYVTHPISNEKIPIWIGNYVLITYGDGAVMGVPAHDERDFAFANKYNLAIKQVIKVNEADNVYGEFNSSIWHESYASKNSICINSDILDNLSFEQAIDKVAQILSAKNLGDKKDTFRLRDWGISRQRYWGTPIPIIHCPDCGEVAVPDEQLPVVLPEHLVPDGGGNILARTPEFLNTSCPQCGNVHAKRETDTMDTFVDSSWYYMRYTCPDASTMVDERNDYWTPMDMYIGGIEHAILHLLYARFWTKVMRDLGLVKFNEPFQRLLTQGMVLNESFYSVDESGKKTWYYPHEVEVKLDAKGKPIEATLKENGKPVQMGGIEKMSKSKNNVIEPRTLVESYGADTARLFTMFAAPPEQSLEWNNDAVDGCARYLRRLWAFCYEYQQSGNQIKNLDNSITDSLNDEDKKCRFAIHSILKQASYDFDRIQYNTVVSAAMKLLNALEDGQKQRVNASVIGEGIRILLCILYPIVPHITYALWQDLALEANYGNLFDTAWPQVDESALKQDNISLTLQINGKTKGQILVPSDASKEQIEEIAMQSEIVVRTGVAQAKKIIVVPNRLVNIVI
ncbi:MAG: leucine--tRNA ligase [Pseudomonadota bacterium]|jgi:leucyl-tRNA synthetase